MRILMVGDVIGRPGRAAFAKYTPKLRQEKKVDLVVVNGENSADTNGITPDSAEYLLNCGVDLITTGNHSFQSRYCPLSPDRRKGSLTFSLNRLKTPTLSELIPHHRILR